MSVLVHLVVGELDLLEGHDLFAQLVTGERRVGVRVQPVRSGRIRLARDQPRRPVVRVTVTLVVHGHDVHQHRVPLVGSEPRERHPNRREHSPVKCAKRVTITYIFKALSPAGRFFSRTRHKSHLCRAPLFLRSSRGDR